MRIVCIDYGSYRNKKNIHRIIDKFKDRETLEFLHLTLDEMVKEDADFWDELSVVQKQEIDKGLNDVDQFKTTKHSEVIQQSKKWLTK